MDAAVYTLLGTLAGAGLGSGLTFYGQRSLAARHEQAERKLAHDARVYAKRSIAYDELLAVRAKQCLVALETYPMSQFGATPEQPTGLSVDDSIGLVARVDAVISAEVRTADDAMSKAFQEFRGMVMSHASQHFQKTGEQGVHPDSVPVIEKQRVLVQTAYDDLASAIRVELTRALHNMAQSEPP